MAMKAPDLTAFKAIPMQQKVAMLVLVLVGIGVGFYFYVEDPFQATITNLKTEMAKLDTGIITNKARIAKLEELKQLNADLQRQLAKNLEYLPPEEEAVTLLKQLSNLGTRIGLDLKLWKPGIRTEDSSKLFVRLPVDVEMSGGDHTFALFFVRIGNVPRIIHVKQIKMGGGEEKRGRVSVPATLPPTAFPSPAPSPPPRR